MEIITHHTLYQWESRNFPSCVLFRCGIHACRTWKNLWKPHTALLRLRSSVWSSSVTLTTSLRFSNNPSVFRLKLRLFLEPQRVGCYKQLRDLVDGGDIFAVNRENMLRFINLSLSLTSSSSWFVSKFPVKISFGVCLKELRRRVATANWTSWSENGRPVLFQPESKSSERKNGTSSKIRGRAVTFRRDLL